jgi:hypothetical protein
MVLLVVIAVAVTVITAGAAVAALAPASAGITTLGAGIGAVATGSAVTTLGVGTMVAIGAGSAALGSIVSQGVGVATGIQNEFSWKAVGMAAIGGGVGAGLSGAFSGIGNNVVRGALQGVSSNALTQGIGVVTGLQDKFDWAGVAAAGVGGGVSGAFQGRLGGMNKYAAQTVSSGAAAIAASVARTLVTGTSFGDNLLGALPDVIGSTIGNMVADSFAASYDRSRLEARVNRLAQSESLSERMRGTEATVALVRDAVGNGATDDEIFGMIAVEEAAAALAEALQEAELDFAADRNRFARALYTGEEGPILLASGIPRRYSLEGGVEEFVQGLKGVKDRLEQQRKLEEQRDRERFTEQVKLAARKSIEYKLKDPKLGRAAREVLESFLSGTGPRRFDYDEANPKTAYGVKELLNHKPSDYFREQETGIIKFLMKREGRPYVLNGDKVTDYTYDDFTPVDGYRGQKDGVQIGDVVGTMSKGWNMEVKNGRIYLTAINETHLESFAAGNILPGIGSRVILPRSGPMSLISQTYRYSIPIPKWAMPPRPPQKKP